MTLDYFGRDLEVKVPPKTYDRDALYLVERGEGISTEAYQHKFTDFI